MGGVAPSPNFEFLSSHDPYLVVLGAQAERNFASDPNTTLLKLRQLAEQLAQRAAAQTGIYAGSDEKQVDLLRRLEQRGTLQRPIAQLFHGLRTSGNKAMHELRGDTMEALHQLKMARQIAIWFHRTFGRAPSFNPGPFVPPVDPHVENRAVAKELERLRDELAKAKVAVEQQKAIAEREGRERLSAQERAKKEVEERTIWEALAAEAEQKLAAELQRLQVAAVAQPPKEIQKLVALASDAAERIDLDEAATRRLIDEQLRAAGWQVDTDAISHQQGVRPQKGKNLAIAEWPADDPDDAGGHGRADYVLFVGLKAVGIVEAKRKKKDVSSVLQQAKRYARGLDLKPENLVDGGPWSKSVVPFLFATNGRPYLKQLEAQSGVWFLDARKTTNHPRALDGWHSPEGLEGLLKTDVDHAAEELRQEPVEILGLHAFQRQAIRAVEEGLASGRRSMLLAMATGTGKTRTAIGLCYRLIKSKAVRRILFLVDRTSLGMQAQDAFKDARIETSKTFADIYELKELKDIRPEPDTKVHFATVQGLIQRVLYPIDKDVPTVDQYDCIIIDECHRGYSLDRDLSETELEFRDFADYVSQYRRVLEHFDAIKIGLTATPALHTTEIFGRPIFQYSYPQAVIDGFLIDHEPPIRIVTALAEDGITWKKGEGMEVYDPTTQTLDTVTLPDDVSIEVEGFNKRVVTESFNEVVCAVLADHLDPTNDVAGKTLIFCATDQHADLVVTLLKKALEKSGSVDDDAVMKITGASDQPLQLIRRLKNEKLPNIAVTVDLLTTGIDVPRICNIVFLRRVRSRILYDQMLGRATRKCDEIGKEVFRIFDAVDLYPQMQHVSDMKPVVTDPSITFGQLAGELGRVTEAHHRQLVLDQLIVKLQAKAGRLKGESLERFETMAGMSPRELLEKLRHEPPDAAKEWFATRGPFVALLDESLGGKYLIISRHADVLREVTRGYGQGEKPEDYLEAFEKYLATNLNQIPALVVVTQRPRELTRQQLKELKVALESAGFRESYLRTAWRDKTNADIAASIIGFIRQAALGDALVSYDERVDKAMARILQSRPWTPKQRDWLKRIGKQLKLETIVDREALEQGQFKTDGGFARIDKAFDGKLEEVLGDLRGAIWDVPRAAGG